MTFPDGKEKKQYIRVVDCLSQQELHFIDVGGMKKHGLVQANGQFGALQFSYDETKLLYVADKDFKASQYYDTDLDWTDEEKIEKANLVNTLNYSLILIF